MAERGHDDDTDLLNFVPERLTEDGDLGPNGSGGKARSLLVAGALIGVAIAGAAGWYVLAGDTASDGKVSAPLIPADDTPYKVRPADPGGMQVPNQDKLVYDRLEPTGVERPEVETLLPEPTAPSEPPAVPEDTARLPKAAGEGPMAPPPPPTLEGETAPSAGVRIPEEPVAAAPEPQATPEPAEAPAAQPAPAPAKPAEAPATPAAAPDAAPAPVVKDTAPQPSPPAPAAKEATTAPGGDYMVQLAALRSEDAARKSWQRLQGKYPDLLGGLSLVVGRADLGDKGIFYRVRATGLPSEEKAKDVCAQLAKDKVGCLFVGKQ